jgi:hypothetical protein
MNTKLIVFTGLLSISFWGIGIYNSWFNEIFLFGYNVFTSWFDENTPDISTDEDVTTVRYGEFAYKLLTDIVIPANITTVENNAFKGNKLTSVTIGSNVSLGENAVGYDFEDVYKGNGRHAGIYTRTDAKSTVWIIWDDNFGYINQGGIITITGYKGTDDTVLIPSEINGNPVTGIGKEAFRGKNLAGVTIPVNVTSIGESAFRDNQLTGITIPNSVDYIGDSAFYNNRLTSISISNTVTDIRENAFRKNRLDRITIPNKVNAIEVNAFAENQIIRVNIGANVTLGSFKSTVGVLGENTGFNTAYDNNKNRAGIYTRPGINTTAWTRYPR